MAITKTINKKKYTFRFSMLTLNKFCELRGIEFHEFDDNLKKDSINSLLDLFSRALFVGTNGEIDFNRFEIDELIELMDAKDFADIKNEWLNSLQSLIEILPSTENVKKK